MGPGAPLVIENILAGMAGLCGADGAALMLLDAQDRLRLVGASDEDGILLESAQEYVGDGPAIESASSGDVIMINDLHAAAPLGFPQVAARAVPVRAVLSVPLSMPFPRSSELIGVLDFYTRIGREWDRAEMETGAGLGELMVIVLQVLAESRTESSQFGQV